jgi:antitoxin StbD
MCILMDIPMDTPMTTLLTRLIATMTELREPQKVLDRAGGKPVAILKNNRPVAYLVPVEAAPGLEGHRYATREEVMAALERTRERAQPVLDTLRDK